MQFEDQFFLTSSLLESFYGEQSIALPIAFFSPSSSNSPPIHLYLDLIFRVVFLFTLPMIEIVLIFLSTLKFIDEASLSVWDH